MFKISPTKLQTYLDCPRKYYYVYILGIREPINPSLAIGQVVHNTIDGFFSLRPDLRTPTQVHQIFSNYWRAIQGQKGGFHNQGDEQYALAKAMRLIDAFLAVTDSETQPFHHHQKLLSVPIDNDLIFQGKIDRLDQLEQGFHLIDYKTGSTEHQNEWQIPMYMVMVEYKFIRPVKVSHFWYLDQRKTVPIDPIQHPIRQTIDRVHEIVHQIPTLDDIRLFQCPHGACEHCERLADYV